jgi:DNA-binding transcriptional MerR regulator
MVTRKVLPPETTSKADELFSEGTAESDHSDGSSPTAQVNRTLPPRSAGTKGWLTREESARLLAVTTQTIKNYEKRRLLHPLPESRIDQRGRKYTVMVHDPAELVKVKKLAPYAKSDQDTSSWWTRDQAVNSLNVATQTLKNYEKRGVLHPLTVRRQDKRGYEQSMIVYDPKELAKIPRAGHQLYSRDSGELASKAFQFFEEGKNNREIVIKLRVTPDEVRDLRERWLDDGGAGLVISNEAKDALEQVLGAFADVTDLVALVTQRLKAP